MPHTKRTRLVDSAFELFTTQGYDATSVDDIATRAGVSRSTFFRHFPTKESVVFPDHDTLFPQVEAHLTTATQTTWQSTLRETARMVMDYYLAEGDVARKRYRLIGEVPALRDREAASAHRYQRLFAQYLRDWVAGPHSDGALRCEILSSAVIAANNHVIRSWLRGDTQSPEETFSVAMDQAFASDTQTAAPSRRTIVIQTEDDDIDRILTHVRSSLLSAPSD